MDEERKRRIEAGKSKLAEFKKKKNRIPKSNSPSSNVVSSTISEKNCPDDPGGTSSTFEQTPVYEKEELQSAKNVISEVLFVESVISEPLDTATNIAQTMDSSPQHDNLASQPDLSPVKSSSLNENQSLQENNSSIDSFTIESVDDQSGTSSSSDNSTITGFSPSSSKDESIAESESSEISFTKFADNIQLAGHSSSKQTKDNRPDEEKAFESILTEEKDLLVEEIFVSKEAIFEITSPVSENLFLKINPESKSSDVLIDQDNTSLAVEVLKDDKSLSENVNASLSDLLNFIEAEDGSSDFLNAGDTHFSSVIDHYQIKIKKYQEAIEKRDSVIHKLSKTLETTMNANQAAHSDGKTQIEKLKEEINLLQLKVKETADMLKKQKQKNGNIELENCACQTDGLQLIKCDSAIQVETSFGSLLQNCDLSESTIFELFFKKFYTNPDSSHMTQKLIELVTTNFSHTHIKELVTLLRDYVSIQSDVLEITDSSSSVISDAQILEKMDSSTVLKKITSLNMVAKLIESLVGISSDDANSFSCFSPSKLQRFFLNSVESGDNLPDLSETESVVSHFNYAEVETPVCKPAIDSISPVERLRQKNLAEDFSLVTDFLQDEVHRICSFMPSVSCEPQEEELKISEKMCEKECPSEGFETAIETDQQKLSFQVSKLETRLKNLKLFDKKLHNVQQFSHHLSMDSDTMTLSEDNIMMEELPLSCISLLSLTDSEYKGDNIPTDSETNYSRKVSLDMSRSMQEREFCVRCERNVDLLREKYENDIMNLKDQLEKSHSAQKKSLLESVKKLKADVSNLKTDKEHLKFEFSLQIGTLCSENTSRLQQLSEKCNEELSYVKVSQDKLILARDELEDKLKELQQKLTFSDKKINSILDEKAQTEILLQNQIADLIQEHEEDLDMLRVDIETKKSNEKRHLEDNCKTLIEGMKKDHEKEMNNFKNQIKKEFEEKEKNLLNEHSKTLTMIEAAHCDESAMYQKRIEQLLEEKCELLSKTTQEYETILNKNHKVLEILCQRLLAKIRTEKENILNESIKSGVDLDVSLSAFENLDRTLENGLLKFLNQNYFMNASSEEFLADETEYLPFETSFLGDNGNMPPASKMKQPSHTNKKVDEKSGSKSSLEFHLESRATASESSLDSDDILNLQAEVNKLQEEFQKDVAFYKDINDQLHLEMESLRQQNRKLEDQNKSIGVQLQEKEKQLAAKESMLTDIDTANVNQAAQTNSRLLHVLSDLVKTFLDIEHDINAHLLEYGLVPTRSGTLNHHDDDTGQSVGSREDFTSLSLGECPNLELTEDGPDLTPRACDVFIPSGNYDTDLEGEDVVLGASRRLRLAVDHVLNILSRALENLQSQDLKLLLKRNEELSLELQEESQGRDAVNMELVTAESTVRRLESEKARLEDSIRDLKNDCEILKRELNIERSKVSHLQHEKECDLDKIHTLKEQCELLASRLGDPGKTEKNKMLNPSGTCLHENSGLLEENSRLSSEKQSVQKSLSKERQSYLDRLHEMEIAIDELNAEKDDLNEKKCKEIRDLKAEMEAMEKQLQSNRKFIEQQALEREQEREEFMNKISRMEEFVKEKERIQSSESQLNQEIESLEELLRARIEDHKNAMIKKDEIEKELRISVDKIRDLREIIEELEKQLDLKSKNEAELRQKLATVYESIPNQDKSGSLSDSGDSSKNVQTNRESMEHFHNLKEQLASQSKEIEIMSQNQTLLQELRGQIHFLEAKVEQRVRQLESFLSAASSPIQSGATSPSGSQDSEPMQIPCEDGWEMSPRSVHWLEIKRLEEKIGRLAHIDEEMIKKSKELEQQLKKVKASYSECEHENSALQEKFSEQLIQISALKAHIEEQKNRCSTPQKSRPFSEKIEDLQEKLEKQIETNKKLMSDLQKAESAMCTLQEENCKKKELIFALQKNIDDKAKPNISNKEKSDFSTVDDLKNELAKQAKLVEVIEKENEELKSDIDYLKTENTSLKSLLEKAEKEIEIERAQVESLCEEMANLSENPREGLSDNKTNNTETNDSSLSEETQDYPSKLIDMQSRLKAKNAEILTLKASVTKLKSSLQVSEKQLELEKKKLEQDFNTGQNMLQQRERELATVHEETESQKRLEQDFNTRQNMLQQNKRELSTLHEETDSQIYEAEIEGLEKKLCEQKDVEAELRKTIEDKDLFIQTLTENHKKELNRLKKQATILKKLKSVTECETDIREMVKKIMEASDTFKSDETKALQEILVNILRNYIDSILNKIKQQHEERIKSINMSWQEEIDKFNFEKEKIRTEADALWQEKIKDINILLKSEEDRCKKLSESAKSTEQELQAMYNNELATLRQNLDGAVKERQSLETTIETLNTKVQRLKQIAQDKYDSKLSAVSKTIQESFEKEQNRLQMELNAKLEQEKESFQKEKNRLQLELNAKLEQEKESFEKEKNRLQLELNAKLQQEREMKLKHREELTEIHRYFEARWAIEMKKVKDFQAEDLEKLKINNKKMLEEKLEKAKEDYEEKNRELQKYKEELALLQVKYEKEKKFLISEKEKAVKEAADLSEKKLNANFEESQKNYLKLSEDLKNWHEEKLKLITSHRKQLSALQQELKDKYQKQLQELKDKYQEQLQEQYDAHNDEIKRLEEIYNKKVEEAHDMIKEAKLAASKAGYSGSGFCRTTTPSSDVTSSDEACSSCQEDMLYVNKHILVDKIHQDGKRVLSLIESSSQPYATVKEAHLWLEERKWVVNMLKNVAPATSNGNLKAVITDLVDEIQKFRQKFEVVSQENSELQQQYEDLEQKLGIQYSKLCGVSAQLKKEKASNAELESLVTRKSSEILNLKKQLSEANRLIQNIAEKETNSCDSASLRSPSYEIECVRSADDPKSAEKFSLFLPKVEDSVSLDQKTPSNKASYTQDLPPIPRFDTPPSLSVQNGSLPGVTDSIKNDISPLYTQDLPQIPRFECPPLLSMQIENESLSDVADCVKNDVFRGKEKLFSVVNKGIELTDAKLHCLYWVYRRSQSYNRALKFQKQYLMRLLKGFLETENLSLAVFKCMKCDNYASSPSSDITMTNSFLHPKSRFRSVVFMVVALERMKSHVRRRRHLARIPSSQVIDAEIKSVLQNYLFLSPAISPECYQHSSQSLSSVAVSQTSRDCKNSWILTSQRAAENKSNSAANPDKSKLIEYVYRLEILQKQLGLDNLR